MPDPTALPVNVNYIFVPAPLTLVKLRAILDGIESDADVHPVSPDYPTNSWVTHLYSAITDHNRHGFAILYTIPPEGETGKRPVKVAQAAGANDHDRALSASQLIGNGGELIGYEDVAGPVRIVAFRAPAGPQADPGEPAELSWKSDRRPERDAWSATLIDLVGQNQTALEKGNPDAFAPGYQGLAAEMKTKFWAELLVAMARFESSWNPGDVYAEPPPLGVNSIGLLQLSRQDQGPYGLQPQITDEDALKDATLNLKWSVAIFTHLVSRERLIASGVAGNNHGAARYWSVLRAGHKVELIRALTRKNVGL